MPVGANLSFTKEAWRLTGGFDREYDGAYGLDEFDFAAQVLAAGGMVYSDPGAYVHHIPHPTLFGGRTPERNMGVFNTKFRTDHQSHEREYVTRFTTPHYWGGGRKRPLLGDAVELNDWGAPPGFVPPLHLRLSRTLRPLIDGAERIMHSEGREARLALAELQDMVHQRIDTKNLAETSPGLIFTQDMQGITSYAPQVKRIQKMLVYWMEGALAAERQLRRQWPNAEDADASATPSATMDSAAAQS